MSSFAVKLTITHFTVGTSILGVMAFTFGAQPVRYGGERIFDAVAYARRHDVSTSPCSISATSNEVWTVFLSSLSLQPQWSQ